jgi:hypothetical protein
MLRPLQTEDELRGVRVGRGEGGGEDGASGITVTQPVGVAGVDVHVADALCGTAAAADELTTAHQQLQLTPGAEDAVADAARLRGFYAGLSTVRASAAGLAAERARLQAEAASLRALLQQYHDGAKAVPPVLAGTRLHVTG